MHISKTAPRQAAPMRYIQSGLLILLFWGCMHRILASLALLISTAAFAQPSTTEMVPMRDGVRLATDIFLPAGKGPWPVILVRTPYNKSKKLAPDAFPEAWLKNGYAYVEQDWRGLFASEGKYSTDVFPGPLNQT